MKKGRRGGGTRECGAYMQSIFVGGEGEGSFDKILIIEPKPMFSLLYDEANG